jgi:hypothetical protein
MFSNRSFVRGSAVAAVVALSAGVVPALTSSADAARAKRPGKIATATLGVSAPAYHFDASWSAASATTSYAVRLADVTKGTTLATGTVAAPTHSWSADAGLAKASAGDTVRLTVTPFNGATKGTAKTASRVLADITAPSGSYRASESVYTATLTQLALADDSGAAAVTRTVDWGDGSAPETWTGTGPLTHTYATQSTFAATVTLKDAAGNTTVVPVSVPIHDTTAPVGTFAVSWDNNTGDATVTPTVTEDFPDGWTGSIDWADGSPSEAFTTSDPLTHHYGQTANRYPVAVTLTDKAGNVATPAVDAVVINDLTAPTGTYTAGPAKAWASYTKVALTQVTETDNWSPAGFVTRSVAWGDGTVTTGTAAAGTVTHVYKVAGTFTPVVTLTDEAHNSSAPIAASAVTVTKDTVAPRVALRLPTLPRTSVRKWTTLRGTVKDAGVGVRAVRVRAVEKRGLYWFAYRPATHRWVKTGKLMSTAFAKTGLQVVTPGSTGGWAARLVNLRKGYLVFHVQGVDRVANVSKVLAHAQKLTRS